MNLLEQVDDDRGTGPGPSIFKDLDRVRVEGNRLLTNDPRLFGGGEWLGERGNWRRVPSDRKSVV